MSRRITQFTNVKNENFRTLVNRDFKELIAPRASSGGNNSAGYASESLPLTTQFKDGYSIGNLPSTADWQEISGIAIAQRAENAGNLWAQSDGSINKLLAVSLTDASSRGEWTLTGVVGVDHEDLASATIGGQPYLYLADMGDNGNARATIIIYRIKEPVITGSNSSIGAPDIEAITCQFPAGDLPTHKDAECLLVDPDTGKMYIITKREAVPGVYSLDHQASYVGTQTLVSEGDMFDIPDVASTAATGNVVGGCISPNGLEILIKSYGNVYLFTRPSKATHTIFQTLQLTPLDLPAYVGGGVQTSHPSQEPQGEAICYSNNSNDFYTASEFVAASGSTAARYPLFKYERTSAQTTVSFQDGVSPDGSYAGTRDTYIWDTNPATDNGTAVSMVVDAAPGVESDQRKSLLKFDLSSIPVGSTVVGARLDLYINTEGQGYKFHKMLIDWNESSTYNSLSGGVDNDGVDAAVGTDCINGVNLDTLIGSFRNNMTIATVQSWVSFPNQNYGWLIEPFDLVSGDGVQFDTRQGVTPSRRPKLTVRYI